MVMGYGECIYVPEAQNGMQAENGDNGCSPIL